MLRNIGRGHGHGNRIVKLQSHWEFLTVVAILSSEGLENVYTTGTVRGRRSSRQEGVIAWMWTAIDLIHCGREEMHGVI